MRLNRVVHGFLLALLLPPASSLADIQSQAITLNLEDGTISPGAPTINIRANPSVVIQVHPSKCQCTIRPTFAQPRKALAARSAALATELTNPASRYDSATIQSLKQEQIDLDKKKDDETKTDGSAIALNFEVGPPAATRDDNDGHQWKVTLPAARADYVVALGVKEQSDGACGRPQTYYVVIHVDSASFELNWSAGFAVSSLSDERLRLDPNPATGALNVVSTGTSGPTSNLVALAHYCYSAHGWSWLCVTSGLGTDLPSTGLLLLGGVAARLRPLQNANSFYLTAGAVYGPRKVLGDDYAGRPNPMVPVGTTTSSLLTTRYGFGLAVALSYGFISGAEDKFKGVFSGNSTASAPAPTGPPSK